ncbi:hypothetical protein EMQ_2053 [Acetobacter aceti NBRC 14818]|uniref:Uncharacterized protein n=2 Tax=Acetobacter aceti TaxID=435 RepID=A0A6S6PEA0_ACEAC|nr:hypothetical protein AAJCM20276_01870 [Acetobacter aceti]BCK76447.1 hypothetical protein EMQ_2053 [Acetobacter aceti NBRC 14818]GAN56188.1 hypothetical protein Abac_003_087 [Acetobacter aceti NBRC 14818]
MVGGSKGADLSRKSEVIAGSPVPVVCAEAGHDDSREEAKRLEAREHTSKEKW